VTTLPIYTNDDYTQTFLNLLPTGRIWDKDVGSPLTQAISALVPSFSLLSERATNLITDSFVLTTNELLPQWESSLNLPDPCQGVAPTLESRRNEAVARFIGLGGLSIPFFVDYAATLGYTVQIQEFSPFFAERNTAESELWEGIAAYLWQVNASNDLLTQFEADVSAADEELWEFASTVLQCEFTRLAPAHTTVVFTFNSI
jgi:uncharacterized protein YmfQ (DUF2313 family)